ncbi:hypothetical protein CEXT_1901 [Caerostris extrusa]|uniref:Uncharacterized protein n=1 Tax=Caerostris extrusa TaxID=172846 RepID=A0AAV4XN02_CAEEX|nr:hypothetical protein CEXT_1901 [Caerostris extrusa]
MRRGTMIYLRHSSFERSASHDSCFVFSGIPSGIPHLLDPLKIGFSFFLCAEVAFYLGYADQNNGEMRTRLICFDHLFETISFRIDRYHVDA